MSTGPPWEAWAPPLSPPAAEGQGLPYDQALALAEAHWDEAPHLFGALAWEAWAALLPPTPTVAQVATGSQSVSYSPPRPGGDYGLAIARAEWHRGFLGTLGSAPLVLRRS